MFFISLRLAFITGCVLLPLMKSNAEDTPSAISHRHDSNTAVDPHSFEAAPRQRVKLGDLSRSQPASTRKMAELLQHVYRSTSPRENVYKPLELIALTKEEMAAAKDLDELAQTKRRYASALLDSGQSRLALKEFDELYQTLVQADSAAVPRFLLGVMCARGVAHLRIGEQENCLHYHNADSCLFPIQGGGVHQAREGSLGAVEVFSEVLERFPGDARAQWLLNIAYMTLGEYPERVPAQWLIPPRVFESEYTLPRFPDVASALNLKENELAGGIVMEDFDDDGFLDLMITGWGLQSQMRLFRNQGDGTFQERTSEAGLEGLVSGLNMLHADYDNDGFLDVLILRGAWLGPNGKYPNTLLRNNGDFTFTDVTEEAGLLSFHPTQTATWFDYDSDGDVDLFVGNESRDDQDPNPCELFRNNGDGTFTECAEIQQLAVIDYIKGVSSADYNNDGRPDLFLSSRSGKRHLFRNDGPAAEATPDQPKWKFTEVSQPAGVGRRHRSFPCWFFDYNNDGWEDLVVTGYAIQDVGDIAAEFIGVPTSGERARAFKNNGDGTFSDVSRELGVAKVLHTMGCNFGDLDNDGWLDFYLGTGDPDYATLIPNRMFRNDAGRRFQDVTTAGGFGQLQKGHGIAFGDLDNDGDQDVYSNVGGALAGDNYPDQLFQNPGNSNRWLKLRLVGVQSNRAALGARVRVVVQTPAGERSIFRTVTTGASFGSNPLRQEIGLGSPDAEIARVEVFWPATGKTQTFAHLAADRYYKITEGAADAAEVPLSSFTLRAPDSAKSHHHGH